MFKHPWFLKNYRFSEKDKIDRKVDAFYWTCFVSSAASLGVYGFWIDIHGHARGSMASLHSARHYSSIRS